MGELCGGMYISKHMGHVCDISSSLSSLIMPVHVVFVAGFVRLLAHILFLEPFAYLDCELINKLRVSYTLEGSTAVIVALSDSSCFSFSHCCLRFSASSLMFIIKEINLMLSSMAYAKHIA